MACIEDLRVLWAETAWEELLEAFDAGDQQAFRATWSRVASEPPRSALEMRLQVCFSSHGVRKAQQEAREPTALEVTAGRPKSEPSNV